MLLSIAAMIARKAWQARGSYTMQLLHVYMHGLFSRFARPFTPTKPLAIFEVRLNGTVATEDRLN